MVEPSPLPRIARTVEPVLVVPVDLAKEAPHRAQPRKPGELVDGGDQEAREAPVDRFVHGDNGQWAIALKGALAIHAGHMKVARLGSR